MTIHSNDAPTHTTAEQAACSRRCPPAAVRFSAALGIAALVLTACGDDGAAEDGGSAEQVEDSEAQESESGSEELDLPEGWQHVVGESDFAGIQAEPELPVTVTDGAGEEVEVTDIERIISAGDGISSTLGALGLGENVYAAPEESTSPEGIAAEEHFEFNQNTGVEGLLAMDGTLFIGDNVARHGEVAGQFRDAGVDAVVVDDQSSQAQKLQAVADFVGASEAGEELVAALEEDMEEALQIVEAEDLSEVRIIQVTPTGAGGQNSVAGMGVPGTEVVEELGMISVGVESELRGFSREFSNEGILAADPDVIVIAESDYETWGGEEAMWEAFPTLVDTPAGEQGNVIVMPDAQLRYSSPELGAGAKALAEAISEMQ